MNFVKKIVSSIRDLFSKKAESASPKNNAVGLEESETSNESKFLTLLKKDYYCFNNFILRNQNA